MNILDLDHSGSVAATAAVASVWQVARIEEVDEFNGLLEHVEGCLVQRRRGSLNATQSSIHLPGLAVDFTSLEASFLMTATVRPGFVAYNIPLNRQTRHDYNGVASGDRRIFLHEPGAAVHITGEKVRVCSILWPAERWLGTYHTFFHQDPDLPAGGTVALEVAPRDLARITSLVAEARRMLEKALADGTEWRQCWSILEGELKLALMEASGPRVPMLEPSRHHRNLHALAARCEEYLNGHPDARLSLEDLCAVTGASARSLQLAFRQQLATTPMRYLKLHRLHHLRRLLRQGGPPGATVQSIAAECGFCNMGQLAVEYKALFGESPSLTLAAGCRRAG